MSHLFNGGNELTDAFHARIGLALDADEPVSAVRAAVGVNFYFGPSFLENEMKKHKLVVSSWPFVCPLHAYAKCALFCANDGTARINARHSLSNTFIHRNAASEQKTPQRTSSR